MISLWADGGYFIAFSLFATLELLYCGISSTNFGPMAEVSSRLETSIEPTRKQNPLHKKMIFEALTIWLVIYMPKNAWLCWSIFASTLFGLTIFVKIKFQTIIPDAKKSTAEPETLFRSLGNCDQRQLRIGIELIAKHVIGINRKNRPIVKMFSQKFMRNGDRLNISPDTLITVL